MNARIPCLILVCVLGTLRLPAEDVLGEPANLNSLSNSVSPEATNQAAAIPATVTNPPGVTSSARPVIDAPREQIKPSTENVSNSSIPPAIIEPRSAARADESMIWFAMTGVLTVSVISLFVTWQTSRRSLALVPAAPKSEPPATIAPTLLPVISQAIKEALVQELSAQRRELLTAQQSAATELAQLARRLEAVQAPLLESLGGLRPAALPTAKFAREIPVKIFCGCGQKYAFEVQPEDGHMPFAVSCPACGQDGTPQANQVITRLLNGITQTLPSPGNGLFLNSAAAGIPPQLVDAVKQAVVNELAVTRAEAPKSVPVAAAPEHKNGSSKPATPAKPPETNVANLLAESQSLAEAGQLDLAVKRLEAALALQPDRADTLVKLGGVLEKLDRADEALRHYDRAIALDESLTIAYLNKGGVFNRLARYDEALRCYEQALLKQKKVAA